MEKNVALLLLAIFFLLALAFLPSNQVFVVLTFDVESDLPPILNSSTGLDNFGRVLSFLDSEGVRATFFVTSQAAYHNESLIRLMVENGNEVGSHSFNHTNLTGAGYESVMSDVGASVKLLSGLGARVESFRAPFNQFDDDLIRALNSSGFKVLAGITDYPFFFNDSKLLMLGSKPLLYPSSVYPRSWVSVFDDSLKLQEGRRVKVVVVGIHPWEFVDLPSDLGVYSNSSGNYTWDNLRGLVLHAKSLGAKFVTASQFYDLFNH